MDTTWIVTGLSMGLGAIGYLYAVSVMHAGPAEAAPKPAGARRGMPLMPPQPSGKPLYPGMRFIGTTNGKPFATDVALNQAVRSACVSAGFPLDQRRSTAVIGEVSKAGDERFVIHTRDAYVEVTRNSDALVSVVVKPKPGAGTVRSQALFQTLLGTLHGYQTETFKA